MGGHERGVEPVLDGEAAEDRLRDHEDARGDDAPDQPAALAKVPERHEGEGADQDDDHRRGDPVAELDDLVLLEEGEQAAAAERPALGAAALRPAAEPGVADTDDPADDDQREGRDDGGGQEAAEAAEVLVRFATRGASIGISSGYRGAALGVPAVRLPDRLAAPARLGLRRRASGRAGSGGRQVCVRSRIARRMS